MPSIAGFFSRMRIWKFSGGPWSGFAACRSSSPNRRCDRRSERCSTPIVIRTAAVGLRCAFFRTGWNPSWLLETAAPLYYPRYVLWHKRPLLDVFPCDCAWPGYPTSVSLLSAAFGRDAAARAGAELAVLENRDGTLTHVDDEPLFLVSAGEVFTTPLAAGATDSVMRRLVLAVCRAEKIAVCECPLTRGMLTHCEEAFTVSVQGIVSLLGYGDYRYFNLMAVKLAERINDVRL